VKKTNTIGAGNDYRTESSESGSVSLPARTLRVGVIGLGIGRHHIQGYRKHPGAFIAAVADTNSDRAAAIAGEFDIPAHYSDPLEMLRREKLDIVSICTPNKFHKPLTIAALESGCHVLCEKPMAMNADEAREMIAAAEKAGLRIMINFSYRFTDQSAALKSQVDMGTLGDVYYGRTVWHRRRGMPGFGGWFGEKSLSGGGPLIDLGVHRLDLALWLMGNPEPDWVLGSTYNHIASERAKREGKSFTVEDLAAGFIRFKNGASLSIEASWAANIKEAELMETRLLGTRAGLVQRNRDEGYEFEAEIFLESGGSHFNMNLNTAEGGTMPAMWHFTEAILNNSPHSPTGAEGLRIMEILDALYRSAETGAPVHIGK